MVFILWTLYGAFPSWLSAAADGTESDFDDWLILISLRQRWLLAYTAALPVCAIPVVLKWEMLILFYP